MAPRLSHKPLEARKANIYTQNRRDFKTLFYFFFFKFSHGNPAVPTIPFKYNNSLKIRFICINLGGLI